MNLSKLQKKTLNFLAVSLGCAGALTACGPKAVQFNILPLSQGSVQNSTANNKVDILWVIDNSGSMYTKQERLGQGISSFVNVLSNKDFDFNMAVVTTDILGQAGQFQSLPYPYQDADPLKSIPANYVGANGSSILVLNNLTPNLAGHFTANARVGDTGAANAQALDAIKLSLSPALLSGANANFLRSDAHLAVIAVSDADDDDSVATTDDVISFLRALKPDKFDVLTRKYKKNFTISAVVVDTSNPANAACPLPFEDGVKFKTLANATNGSVASICEADFSQGLTSVSQRIAEAITEIPLARVPDASTITVLFNGNLVPKSASDGWTYESDGNKVLFHGNFIPRDGTSISIGYTPNDIIR